MGEDQAAADAALEAFADKARAAEARVKHDAALSTAKIVQINSLNEALKNASLAKLSSALDANLLALTGVNEGFTEVQSAISSASDHFHELVKKAELLSPTEAKLIQSEATAVSAIAAFLADVNAAPDALSNSAHATWENLTEPLEAMKKFAVDCAAQADSATDTRASHVGALAASVDGLLAAAKHGTNGRIADHWNGLTAAAGAELQQTQATGGAAFAQAGQSTRASILSGATNAVTSIADRAAQLNGVLTQMNDLAEKARQLQMALRIASGGLG